MRVSRAIERLEVKGIVRGVRVKHRPPRRPWKVGKRLLIRAFVRVAWAYEIIPL